MGDGRHSSWVAAHWDGDNNDDDDDNNNSKSNNMVI